MRSWTVVALIAGGCGNTSSGSGGSAAAPTPTVTAVAGSAAAAPPVRLDREPVQLGGARTWAGARGLRTLRYCPGDRELVALDEQGFVRRYRADDGRELSAVSIGIQEEARAYHIDCRDDGTVLAIGAANSPVLVDAKGTVRKPPRELRVETVRFADDGMVRMLAIPEGALSWNDRTGDITETFKIPESTLYYGLGDGGVFVGWVYNEAHPERSYTWMHRDDGELRLQGRLFHVDEIAVSRDRAVVVRDYMVATAWTLTGKKASKQILLLDQSGSHVKAVAASNKWMIAVGADSVIRAFARPSQRKKEIRTCAEYGTLINVAISRDETRIAAICQDSGIVVFGLESGKQAVAEPPSSASLRLAWSPSGARLATRSADGTIRVWRDAELEAKISADSGTTIGWRSETELAGDRGLQGWRWQLPGGKGEELELPRRTNFPMFGRGGTFAGLWTADRAGEVDLLKVVSAAGKEQVFEIQPQDGADKLHAFDIGADGRRAVVLRGPHHAGSPANQLTEIDLEAGTTKVTALAATAVALAGDDTILASPAEGLLRRTRGTAAKIGQHGAKVTALAAAGDVIAAGGDDGAITLWSGSRKLGRLTGHGGPIRALAFAPDGLRLASAGDDATRVWDLRP